MSSDEQRPSLRSVQLGELPVHQVERPEGGSTPVLLVVSAPTLSSPMIGWVHNMRGVPRVGDEIMLFDPDDGAGIFEQDDLTPHEPWYARVDRVVHELRSHVMHLDGGTVRVEASAEAPTVASDSELERLTVILERRGWVIELAPVDD